MQNLNVNEAGTYFDELIDRMQRKPVQVTRRNRAIGVMVSAEDHHAMPELYADRLRRNLKKSAEEAAARGLTVERLEQLLAND